MRPAACTAPRRQPEPLALAIAWLTVPAARAGAGAADRPERVRIVLSFRSLRDALMIFNTVLFARVGGVIGLHVMKRRSRSRRASASWPWPVRRCWRA